MHEKYAEKKKALQLLEKWDRVDLTELMKSTGLRIRSTFFVVVIKMGNLSAKQLRKITVT